MQGTERFLCEAQAVGGRQYPSSRSDPPRRGQRLTTGLGCHVEYR